MKILVTGASGLLGATLCYQWEKNPKLVILGIYNAHPSGLYACQLDLPDSGSEGRLSRLIETFSPDWIVHCAAKTDLDWCETNPMLALKVNVEASVQLSTIASYHGVRVIYISTDSVFSGTSDGYKYTESDMTGPVNHYARTKLMAEQAFHIHRDIIVRGSFYGWNLPHQPRKGLFQSIYDKLSSGEYVDGWNDVYFSPLSTLQMADVLLDMMCRDWKGGIYHLGCQYGYSKYEFALELSRVFCLLPNVRSISYSHIQSGPAQRPLNLMLDTTKLEAKLGYFLSLDIGLERLREFQETDLSRFRSMTR